MDFTPGENRGGTFPPFSAARAICERFVTIFPKVAQESDHKPASLLDSCIFYMLCEIVVVRTSRQGSSQWGLPLRRVPSFFFPFFFFPLWGGVSRGMPHRRLREDYHRGGFKIKKPKSTVAHAHESLEKNRRFGRKKLGG